MPVLRAIPPSEQHEEPWANQAGSTRVILREPDTVDWRIRISVAKVERDGPFSALASTRRMLVPLDAAMVLRFPDGRELHARRFATLRFDGAPAPTGLLPDGPTRDFNLMLRAGARGELFPRTLVNSMLLPLENGIRWLAYLHNGQASVSAADGLTLTLAQGGAALISADADAGRVLIEGACEIVLAKLWMP